MKMDVYGTHQALLVAALSATKGDIIEIGGGWYSTPLISAHANTQKRFAYTIETGEFVYNILKRFDCEFHKVRLMEGFDFNRVGRFAKDREIPRAAYLEKQHDFLEALWREYRQRREATGGSPNLSVAFVDQAPGFLRTPAIEFFADKADFVIAHDTEHVAHYGFEPTLSSFKYRWDYQLHRPNSVIVSNTQDCSLFKFLSGSETASQLALQRPVRRIPPKRPRALRPEISRNGNMPQRAPNPMPASRARAETPVSPPPVRATPNSKSTPISKPSMKRRIASLLPPFARRRLAALLRRLRGQPATARR